MNTPTTSTRACIHCGNNDRPDLLRDGECWSCRRFENDVRTGLRYARLEPLPGAELWRASAPHAQLGSLTISDGGRGYWRVSGLVPLSVAKVLYADPAGRDLIRVTGHCGCPPPEEWITWMMPDGREVIAEKERAAVERMANGKSEPLAAAARKSLTEVVFSDSPADIGASPFICGYHIDGNLGLRVFVDTLRSNT